MKSASGLNSLFHLPIMVSYSSHKRPEPYFIDEKDNLDYLHKRSEAILDPQIRVMRRSDSNNLDRHVRVTKRSLEEALNPKIRVMKKAAESALDPQIRVMRRAASESVLVPQLRVMRRAESALGHHIRVMRAEAPSPQIRIVWSISTWRGDLYIRVAWQTLFLTKLLKLKYVLLCYLNVECKYFDSNKVAEAGNCIASYVSMIKLNKILKSTKIRVSNHSFPLKICLVK